MHGHTQRVLHMTLSPDNSTVCTASADETLRFWQVFENKSVFAKEEKLTEKLNPKNCSLRWVNYWTWYWYDALRWI